MKLFSRRCGLPAVTRDHDLIDRRIPIFAKGDYLSGGDGAETSTWRMFDSMRKKVQNPFGGFLSVAVVRAMRKNYNLCRGPSILQ